MGLIFTGRGDEHRQALAERVVAEQYLHNPELGERYGPRGRAKCVEDVTYTLMYLDAAVATGAPELFREYVSWLREVLEQVGVADADVVDGLTILHRVLEQGGAAQAAATVAEALGCGRPAPLPCHLDRAGSLSGLAQSYLDALLAADRRKASRLILDAADQGAPVDELYLEVFQPCLREIGRLWQINRLTVAQEHLCTAATQLVMSQLYPRIFDRPGNGLRLVAVCANGELHEIGMRMVADLFEMDGWETLYLGASTPIPAVVDQLLATPPHLLAISATIAPNVAAVAALVAAVRAEPALAAVSVMVGGTPFNQAPGLWRRLGADGTAPDARSALALARTMVTP